MQGRRKKQSRFPKSKIKTVTIHTSEKDLGDYDSGDENQQRIISSLIDNPSASAQSRFPFQLLSAATQYSSQRFWRNGSIVALAGNSPVDFQQLPGYNECVSQN